MDDPALLAGFNGRADCNGVSDTHEVVGNIYFTGPIEKLPVIYNPGTGAPGVLARLNPSLPAGDRDDGLAHEISANGLVVVGEDNLSSSSVRGVKWVGLSLTPSALAANALDPTPDPNFLRVSPSGGFIAGEIGFNGGDVVAFRETHPGAAVQQLTGSSISVFSVNDDGTIFGDSGPDAAIWIGTSTTPTILPSHSDCQPFQRAIAGSSDLSVIVGSCINLAGTQLQGVVWLNQTLPVLMVNWLDSLSVPLPFGLLTEFIPSDMDASGTFLVGTDTTAGDRATVITVPEPVTGVLLAFGVLWIIGLGGMRRNQALLPYCAAFLAFLSPAVFASVASANDIDLAAAELCLEAQPEHQITCMLEALGLDMSEIEAPSQGPSDADVRAAAEREAKRQEALRNRARVIQPE
ncbi:MAG: hypothetical protein IPK00_12705 [Deltaproteobacteria bacterium]|nr:hypothetical protein [Deltaproteobacteria bacterium]